MTEFKKLMIEKGLSNKDAIELFAKTERTISRWRSGEVDTPKACLIVLRQLPSKAA